MTPFEIEVAKIKDTVTVPYPTKKIYPDPKDLKIARGVYQKEQNRIHKEIRDLFMTNRRENLRTSVVG